MKKQITLQSIFILILILSIFARLFFLHPTFSDENFYFNVAKNINEGKTLYRDFFFAHPPLQVYTLVAFFGIFGSSFMIGKMLTLMTSTLCVLLVYFISKELFDKKTAFITAIIFLITPAFLAFSTMGHGMWETTFLVLLSIYLLIKNRPSVAGIIFSSAILFRYLAIIYLPFLLVLLYLRKQKFKNFLISFFATSFISSLLLLSIFRENYIDQTVFYHVFSKVVTTSEIQRMQYWGIGYFFFFLTLISALIGYTKKDRLLFLFAVIPLIVDLTILLGLRLVFYHYFFISLSLCIIATGRALTVSKDWIVRLAIPVILFLSIILNLKTIDFYLNPIYSERFHYIAELVANNTSEEDAIFGEPVITNYVSFITGRRIASDYLDSYLQHLVFEGGEKVIKKLGKDKPRVFIEMEGYYLSNPDFKTFFLGRYKLEKVIGGVPNYSLYKLK